MPPKRKTREYKMTDLRAIRHSQLRALVSFALIVIAAVASASEPSCQYLAGFHGTSCWPVNTADLSHIPRGGAAWTMFPAGYHPLGYAITDLGQQFLKFPGSTDHDVGRFLVSLKVKRKSKAALKENWLEVTRQSKTGQSMRIYRTMDEIIDFCLKAGFIQ